MNKNFTKCPKVNFFHTRLFPCMKKRCFLKQKSTQKQCFFAYTREDSDMRKINRTLGTHCIINYANKKLQLMQ